MKNSAFGGSVKLSPTTEFGCRTTLQVLSAWSGTSATLSTTSDSLMSRRCVTCRNKGVWLLCITAPKLRSAFGFLSLMVQPDGKTIVRPNSGGQRGCFESGVNEATELLSKVANNNVEHHRTCFHSAFNCLLPQIISYFNMMGWNWILCIKRAEVRPPLP